MERWVYRIADGLILHRCLYGDAVKTGTLYTTIDLPDNTLVDVIHHRIDPVTKALRLATIQELLDISAEKELLDVNNEVGRLDVISMITYIIRRENPSAFDSLTNLQKKNLIQQQVNVYRQIRQAIKNILS